MNMAHEDGYAVHAWFSGSAPDDASTYGEVVDTCVDALMPARPSVLEEVFADLGTERPGRTLGADLPGTALDGPARRRHDHPRGRARAARGGPDRRDQRRSSSTMTSWCRVWGNMSNSRASTTR